MHRIYRHSRTDELTVSLGWWLLLLYMSKWLALTKGDSGDVRLDACGYHGVEKMLGFGLPCCKFRGRMTAISTAPQE